MISKWIGALLVFFSCTGWGVSLAMSCRREEKLYCGLLRVLSYMKGELRYHLTSLPELCEQGAMEADGQIRAVFQKLSVELKTWTCPDAAGCMRNVLKREPGIPPGCTRLLTELAGTLGRFDLVGQLEDLDRISGQCRLALEALRNQQEEKLRGFQTLGLCAGAALVILFI